MELKQIAFKFQEYGINVIPTLDKKPLCKWSEFKEKYFDFEYLPTASNGLAVICGEISVIDFDLKNDYVGNLWQRFKKLFGETNLNKFVIQSTPNKGYHLFYRTDKPQTSQVLAYTFQKKPLIETRGFGGLCTVFPTPNYKVINGKFSAIPLISEEFELELFRYCRYFNEYVAPKPKYQPKNYNFNQDSNNKFEAFNRISPLDFLEAEGWHISTENNSGYRLSKNSLKDCHATLRQNEQGIWIFYVWSTSTNYESQRGYTRSQLYYLKYGNYSFLG
jgi:hypothetical protein